MTSKYISNQEYSDFIALSRYARWLPGIKRREHWDETVHRYLDFWLDRKQIDTDTYKYLYNYIVTKQVMSSMRCLMTAGKALELDNVAGYNCAYVAVDDPRVFDEIMYVLMCGTGVGFSCERQEISKLPVVSSEVYYIQDVIEVEDSKIGWAEAFKRLIALLYNGHIPKWDVSKVRPAGAPLKTFGGRASGSVPLVSLFNYTVNLFVNASGRKLTSLEVHGLVCKIAEIVVVGGVRRSALISLSNLSDTRMAKAKSGQWWINNPEYALSNNSIAYTEKPDAERFIREWLNLIESKSGERGIFNRVAANVKVASSGRRTPYHRFGTNPCVAPETLILTINGFMPIKECVGVTTIWNGQEWSDATVEKTSDYAELVTVETTIGILECTENHIWYTLEDYGILEAKDIIIRKTTKELKPNDRLIKWKYPDVVEPRHDIMLSDDTEHTIVVSIQRTSRFDETYCLNEPKRHMCVFNGVLTGQCSEIILRSKQFCNLSEVVARHDDTVDTLKEKVKVATILGTLQSTLTDFRYLSAEWRKNTIEEGLLGVSLTGIMDCPILNDHKDPELAYRLSYLRDIAINTNNEWATKLGIDASVAITCVKPSGCVTLDTKIRTDHGIIPLSEVFRMNGYNERYIRSFDPGTWLETRCSIKALDENNDFQSITRLYINGNRKTYKITTEEGVVFELTKEHKLKTNRGWIAVGDLELTDKIVAMGTLPNSYFGGYCVMPRNIVKIEHNSTKQLTVDIEVANTHTYQLSNGCVSHNTCSQLVDSSSGIHARYAPYYIRTVRADMKDPLAKMMRAEGFPVEPDVTKPDQTYVFSFPVKSAPTSVYRDDRTALEQLELWLLYQDHWCEHKPSITVYVKDHEWLEVGAWVYKHFDQVSGVSFLPHSDHSYQQAPYQEITEEEYNMMVGKMPKNVDWQSLSKWENDDHTTGSHTYACTGSECEIVDLT